MGMFKSYVGFPERGHRSFERNSPAVECSSTFRSSFCVFTSSVGLNKFLGEYSVNLDALVAVGAL